MNKSYLCINNQVVIEDEKGIKPAIEYTDNIEDILISENVIEFLKEKLKKCKQEYEENKGRIFTKKEFIKSTIIWAVIIGLMLAICPFLFSLIIGASELVIDTVFGFPMNLYTMMTIGFSPIVALLGTLSAYQFYSDNKQATNENKGLENNVKVIEQLLVKELGKMQEFNNNKTKKNINFANSNQSNKVNDILILKAMRKTLTAAYYYGYSKETFIQYYQKGTLNEKLKRKYDLDDEDISIYESFIRQDLNNLNSTEENKPRTLRP